MAGYSDPDEVELTSLREEVFALAATQCSEPIAGEYGNMICGRVMAKEADIRKLRKLIHDMSRRWTPGLSVEEVDVVISAALGEVYPDPAP